MALGHWLSRPKDDLIHPMNIIDAKTLFMGATKSLQADCILDIGSRDGDQSLLFRELRPKAYVAAFEANPANYQMIRSRNLERQAIEIFPYAISNTKGTATFYIVDPKAYVGASGSSSLLAGNSCTKEAIQVETRRIDDFVLEHAPDVHRIVLWIDVERAEYEVLEGISKIKDRVFLVHVETVIEPEKENQKTLSDLDKLMKSFGFILCGSSIAKGTGDAVFISEKARTIMGASYYFCMARAVIYRFLPIGRTAVFLKETFPPLHRLLRRIFIKFAS
jgi:FkbM family methyltransferase